MDLLKSSPEAFVAMDILRVMGWAPTRVEDLGVAFFATKSSLVLTNVPGPREPIHMLGVPIERVVFFVPQSGRMGLGISIFSYAGAVTLGVLSDAKVLDDPRVLVRSLEGQLGSMERAILGADGPEARPM